MARRKRSKKKKILEAGDFCRLEVPVEVVLSPDESKAAYIVEEISKDKKKYYTHLFVADIKSGEKRQYTFGKVNDRNPVWSPDGVYIAFLSTRDKKSGIYIIPTEGGSERKLIEEDGAFASLKWTPDGKELVYIFRYNDSHSEKDEKKKKEAPVYRHITRIFYRLDGAGYLPEDRFHIWKVNVENGETKQLTKGSKYDDVSPEVSPDGKWIVYVSNHSADPDVDWNRQDLFLIPIDGGRAKKIDTPEGPLDAPSFSPDGKKIAYVGHDNPDDGWGVTNHHIWVVGIKGRPAAKDIIPKFDRHATDTTIGDIGEGFYVPPLHWSNDGKRIYFASSDLGSTHIFYAPSKGGLPTRVTKRNCHIKSYSMAGKKKTIAMVYSDLSTSGEIHVIPAKYEGDKKPQKLAAFNEDFFKEFDFPKTKEVWFKGHDGFDLQGWLVTPPGFKKTKKYPAILEIHGGPRAQYGFTFFYEMQYLASCGYVVLYTNPRGGTGRGETFADAISGGWGDIDYMDCMSAADYLENLSYVNKNKIGVTGGSYGGFMTNWIVGHTDRFKAAITQRSVVNLESFYGSSDIGYSLFREFDGHPWKNRENYVMRSPLTYAQNVKTPLLIIHSEQDLRCNVEQARELYAYLKMMKKKVEMVLFPEEPHGLSRHGRPDRRIARLNWIDKWFKKYL